MNYFIKLFDLLIKPFEAVHPVWPILFLSFLTSIFMLFIFRFISNQEGIRQTKNRLKAHLLEIVLFRNDFRILMSAQKNLLYYNARYVIHAVKPVLVMIIPLSICLFQMHAWFGLSPLRIGEAAVVHVQLKENSKAVLDNISIQTDKGLAVETLPLRISHDNAVLWRVRAKRLGNHRVTIKTGDNSVNKEVTVSDKSIARVSQILGKSTLWNKLFFTGEQLITENNPVLRVEVGYPERSIKLFGLHMHWLLVFFILTIIFGFGIKGSLGVEI
jgi:hypothetical protein